MKEANSESLASNPPLPTQSSVQYKPPVAPLEPDQSPALPEQSPQQALTSSVEAAGNFQMPAATQKQRSGTINDAPAAPSQSKTADGSASKDQPVPAPQAHDDGSITSTNNNVPATMTLPEQAAPSSIRTISTGTAQLPRIGTSRISSAARQDPAVDTHGVSDKTDTDAEAFQIDLHPVPELAAHSNSDTAQHFQATENSSPIAAKSSAVNQTPNPAQPSTTNTISDQSAAKRGATSESPSAKTPTLMDQAQPAAAAQAPTAASGTSTQAPGVQGQVSLPSPRSIDPNSAPAASARSTQVSAPLEAARPIAPNQMTVRMEGGSGQVINVRFVNQGDQVQVAVRSNDPSTTAQLRQGLTSLSDDLSRIGWKADLSAVSTHGAAALHDASRPDTNSQGSNKGSALDWEQETPRKKSPAAELWEELKDSQQS